MQGFPALDFVAIHHSDTQDAPKELCQEAHPWNNENCVVWYDDSVGYPCCHTGDNVYWIYSAVWWSKNGISPEDLRYHGDEHCQEACVRQGLPLTSYTFSRLFAMIARNPRSNCLGQKMKSKSVPDKVLPEKPETKTELTEV